MGPVGRAAEAEALLAGAEHVTLRHATGGAQGDIIHTHQLADEGAHRLGLGRQLQPVVEATDSSASQWLQAMWRNWLGSISVATASRRAGNMALSAA